MLMNERLFAVLCLVLGCAIVLGLLTILGVYPGTRVVTSEPPASPPIMTELVRTIESHPEARITADGAIAVILRRDAHTTYHIYVYREPWSMGLIEVTNAGEVGWSYIYDDTGIDGVLDTV
jgi:hypothetical protein